MNGAHYVGVLVDELEELLQAPKEAPAATHDGLNQIVVILLQLVVHILQEQPYQSTDGYDQGTESNSSDVVPEIFYECLYGTFYFQQKIKYKTLYLPQCSVKGCGHGEKRKGLFIERPVPLGENPGEDHLPQGGHEEQQPEEPENIDG